MIKHFDYSLRKKCLFTNSVGIDLNHEHVLIQYAKLGVHQTMEPQKHDLIMT